MDTLKKLPAFAARTAFRVREQMKGRTYPKHPIDCALGIETSVVVSPALSSGSRELERHALHSLAAQPSVICAALDQVPIDGETTFIDLGCGKGRAVIVAADYPFRTLTGIELSPHLCDVARRNIAMLRPETKYAERISIINGDASIPRLGKGPTVLWLYNPFQRPLIEKLSVHLVNERKSKLWVIYCNPVFFDVFDASPDLRRYYAALLHLTQIEKPAVHHPHDSVVIYQSVDGQMLPPKPGADAAVKVTHPIYGADVQS
jgi:SAM-dependent methyltransferase